MAVFTGSLGFKRYKVEGEVPAGMRAEYETRIRAKAFQPFGENDPREESVGWVAADDLFDIDLAPDRWLDENAVRLTMRTDKRRVPARLLKKECATMEEEWKVKFARERLSRAERDQVKELVTARLIERALPDIKGSDLYWDIGRGEALFFAGGERENDTFVNLFEKTFGLKLVPFFPFAMALMTLDEEERAIAARVTETAFAPENG